MRTKNSITSRDRFEVDCLTILFLLLLTEVLKSETHPPKITLPDIYMLDQSVNNMGRSDDDVALHFYTVLVNKLHGKFLFFCN